MTSDLDGMRVQRDVWFSPRFVVFVCFVALILVSLCSLGWSLKRPAFSTCRLDVDDLVSLSMIDTPEKYIIKKAFHEAFTEYMKCHDADEVRPLTGECLNSFGFKATLVESIETIAYFNDTDKLKSVRSELGKKFCDSLGIVNRKDVWERVVASFIGGYLLTNQSYFLNEARHCADKIIRIDHKTSLPYVIIDMKNEMGRNSWENGTTLIDAIAGIPEMAALYRIDGNETYMTRILQTMTMIQDLMWLYDPITGKNKTSVRLNNSEMLTDVHETLEIAHEIVSHQSLEAVLSATSAYHSKNDSLRRLIKDSKCQDVIDGSVRVIEKGSTGFVGFVTSNRGNKYRDNRQSSAFIGEIVSACAICLLSSITFRMSSVLNQHGHLLFLKR